MSINEQNLKKSLAERKNSNGLDFSVNETKDVEPQKDKDISQKILDAEKENNRLLKKVVRYQRLETFFSLLKILVIIVPLVLAYIYLAPMLVGVIKNYQSALGPDGQSQIAPDGLKGLGNVDIRNQLKELLK